MRANVACVVASLGVLAAAILVSFPRRVSADDKDHDTVLKELKIVDAKGRVRIRLGTDEKGSPEISLVDEAGKQRAWLGLYDQDRPGFLFMDSKEKQRVSIRILTDDEYPQITLSDKDGRRRWRAVLSGSGEPALELLDRGPRDSRTRAVVQVTNEAGPEVILLDDAEEATWRAPK